MGCQLCSVSLGVIYLFQASFENYTNLSLKKKFF